MLRRKVTYNTFATGSILPSDPFAAFTGTVIGGIDTFVIFVVVGHRHDTRQGVAVGREVVWWKHCRNMYQDSGFGAIKIYTEQDRIVRRRQDVLSLKALMISRLVAELSAE